MALVKIPVLECCCLVGLNVIERINFFGIGLWTAGLVTNGLREGEVSADDLYRSSKKVLLRYSFLIFGNAEVLC